MGTRRRNPWILLGLIIVVVFICGLLKQVDAINMMNFSKTFGLTSPLTLDIGVLELTFGLVFNFDIITAVGLLLVIIIWWRI